MQYNLNIDETTDENTIIQLYNTFLYIVNDEMPNSYWKNNGLLKAKVITKYLIENILNYRRIEIIHKLSIKQIKEYKLESMFDILFQKDLYKLLENAYPKTYCKEMFEGKRNYWDIDLLCEEALKAAEKLGKTVNELTLREFVKHTGIGHNISIIYDQYGSYFNFIKANFPIKHWWQEKHKYSPYSSWTEEEEKEAISYLLFQKNVKMNGEVQYCNFNRNDFEKYGLKFIYKHYNSNIPYIIQKHFPNIRVKNKYNKFVFYLQSPTGEIFKIYKLKEWVNENHNKFPAHLTKNTIEYYIRAITKFDLPTKSFYGWTGYRENC